MLFLSCEAGLRSGIILPEVPFGNREGIVPRPGEYGQPDEKETPVCMCKV